jgi:hypothetical protein
VRLHLSLEPGIFRFEMRKNPRIVDARIALVSQPVIWIFDGNAVAGEAVRDFGGNGRLDV